METRSRKRAEASSAAPSSSPSGPTTRASKRTRLSTSSSSPATATTTATATAATVAATTTTTTTTPTRSVNTRSRASKSKEPLPPKNPLPPMDSNNESSSGSRRDRRGKNLERDSSDKGKEKEHDVRMRDRDSEKGLALNVEGSGAGGDEDDNDSDGGAGILHQNLTSASSALQGLLRKLGAGLDDLLPSSGMGSSSHQSGRLKKILFGLRADGEEGRQVEALTQLCELLSIGTEESLSTFSVDSFVPVLVGLLNHESNPDVMLLAARALTHLCDVLPSSCAAVVHYGAVSIFCARLLTIEYMDLAEQVISLIPDHYVITEKGHLGLGTNITYFMLNCDYDDA